MKVMLHKRTLKTRQLSPKIINDFRWINRSIFKKPTHTEHVKLEQDAIVSLFGQFSSYINNREHFDESFNLSTKEMFEKYVMEDQRKIHFDINESSPEEKNEFEEAREPKIELF